MTEGCFCVKILSAKRIIMSKKIYLDYAATTPLEPTIFEAMEPYFNERYGNASSLHQFGQEAQQGVVLARQRVADFLGGEAREIIFNSGATEGNNSVIKTFGFSKKIAQEYGGKSHIVTTSIEHECVLEAVKFLAKEEYIEATFLPVNKEGFVSVAELEKAIKPNTALVSVMFANNEIGVIQPIAEIGQLLKKINKNRKNRIYFHTDAVQAINYLDCNVQNLAVDYLTLSAHKFYGPKGVGALYVRSGSPLPKFFHGGEQEFKMRAGTHNTPGIVGLGVAIEKTTKNAQFNDKIRNLRDKLIDGVLKNVKDSALNGSQQNGLPNIANFRFAGVEGEALLISLDLEGIAVSTGSACASKSLEPSHVLQAMGLEALEAHSAVRFSLGWRTTEAEIDKVLEALPGIVERLRGISGGTVDRKDKLLKDLGC